MSCMHIISRQNEGEKKNFERKREACHKLSWKLVFQNAEGGICLDQNAQSLRPRITPRPGREDDTCMHQLMDDQGTVEAAAMVKKKSDAPNLSKDHTGILPEHAPLANPYVPFQREGSRRYEIDQGLIRGTLFPGLDLPFMGMVNTKEKNTPLAELQALSFAITELGLYLDTHKTDREALALFEKYAKLYEEGMKEYERRCGPLILKNAGGSDQFNWTKDPWPWEYKANKEG